MEQHYKVDQMAPPGAMAAEVAGLRWLATAESVGGVRTARVIATTPTSITEERIIEKPPARRDAESFGRALAATHRSGGVGWGFAPSAPTSYIASIPLRTHLGSLDDPCPPTWGTFYAQERMMDIGEIAHRRGALSAVQLEIIESLARKVADGDFDSPQPGGSHSPSRLHGDLWAGNVLWTGGPTGAALIDPSAHGGHAETDLAMLDLFGLAYLDTVLGAYNEATPIADGWRDRVALHQIYPLLVHAAIFGEVYGQQAAQTAMRYV